MGNEKEVRPPVLRLWLGAAGSLSLDGWIVLLG